MHRLASTLGAIFRPILVLKDHPVLFHYRNIYVVTVGVIIAGSAIISLLVADYYFRSMFPSETSGHYWLWNLTIVQLFSLFFSKIYHYFALGTEFLKNPRKHFSETAYYNQGGQLGILVGTIWLSISSGINFFACMDLILTAGCLALALGRIGCYSYGCCHGRPTSARFSTVYTHPDSKVLRIFPELSNVPLVPTQLVSAAFNFALFGTMVWILTLSPKAGIVSAYFVIVYNSFRFCIEKYRISVVNISERAANMKLFQRAASSLSLAGLIYLLVVLLLPLQNLVFAAPLTLTEFLGEAVLKPDSAITLCFIFVIYIFTWGIHYKKLGQHFEWN